jgi:beta-lactamase superfamily II metal-dependent hydrolase
MASPDIPAMNATPAPTEGGGNIRIRMYRIGFGDCFLLTFTGSTHVLIDCGVHPSSPLNKVAEAIEHIRKTTGGKLALVVVTHRHADHISGFSKPERFDGFTVGEVWLPWLEDLKSEKANALRSVSLAMASMVGASLAAAGEEGDQTRWILANATGEEDSLPLSGGAAAAPKRNDIAMSLLRGGFGHPDRVQYLQAGDVRENVAGLPGLTVRVIAPSSNPDFLGPQDPPKDQRYTLDAAGQLHPTALRPFAARWEEKRPRWSLEPEYLQALYQEVSLPAQALAFKLDDSLNNTSLALMFELGGKRLFFPGDAQWGNWNSWKDQWESTLGNISFYKVGHHGSVNATPHGALNHMPAEKFAAMASTDTVKVFNKGENPVPYPKLIEAMVRQTGGHFVRSDELEKADGKIFRVDREGELEWVDYEL